MQPLGMPMYEVFPSNRFGSESNVSPEHLANAEPPMLVTVSGIVIDVNPEQPENANSPMFVTLSGIEIDVNP